MLRRRILASAMASVMALSSVAVVASADETAEATKQVKTKADLETYVKSFEKFVTDGVYDYGTYAGEDFIDAFEYAENVLDDDKATVDDYTTAYAMLESVYNSLKIYTSAELKTLISSCEAIYKTDNIMNEELQDLIYSEESFETFADAYDEAESVLGSSDSRLITDAYNALTDAKANLSAKTSITKGQFRTALKSYEALIAKLNSYDGWRRGTFTGEWVNLSSNSAGYWIIQQGIVNKGLSVDFDFVKNLTFGNGTFSVDLGWGAFDASIVNISGAEKAQEYITEKYGELDEIKTVNKTTNEEYVAAYNAAADAVLIFNAWTADETTRATKASVTKLLNQYHSQLVADYKTTDAEELYKTVNGKAAPADWRDEDNKFYEAELTNEGKKTTIKVDDNGYYSVSGTKDQAVAKNSDLLKYIKVTSDDITTTGTEDLALQEALEVAEKYLAESYSDTVYGLDETGTVTSGKGSTAEWTIVWRNLKYALEDKYATSVTEYTKAQVSALVDEAYELAEKTGDAAIFSTEHNALVAQRQAALEWLKEANKDKTYRDGDAVDGKTATDVYTALKGAYDTLNNKLAKYAYSYEEIYNEIADVKDMIDSGDLTANDTLVSALNDTAYYLSTIEASDDDNQAFTDDREFQGYNRLFTDTDNYNADEKALKTAYEALVAEVTAQTTPATLLGDVNKDGVVNALDAAEILKAVVNGTTIENTVGDFNADGTVNALDASAILKYVVGLA